MLGGSNKVTDVVDGGGEAGDRVEHLCALAIAEQIVREQHREVALKAHVKEGSVLAASVGDAEEAVEADGIGAEGGNEVEVARKERRPFSLV